jgi:hypothetical protein
MLLWHKQKQQRRHAFSFAGPRRLPDLLDTKKVADAPGSLVAELWHTYHAHQVYIYTHTILNGWARV